MTREEAIYWIKNLAVLSTEKDMASITEALNMAIGALEHEPKWIPVTERLAEFPCIIQDANGNKPSIPSGIGTVESEDHGTWQIDGSFLSDKLNSCFNWHNRIIAWMPLPDAYREDGEEEQ